MYNQLWLRDCARCNYQIEDRTSEEYARMGEDIEDFMNMLRQGLEHVHAGALRRNPRVTRATHLEVIASIRAGMSLKKLVLTARRFADNYRHAVETFAAEAELWNGARWPVIGRPEPRSCLGLVIHPLQTPEDLRFEGQRMRNCVASYVADCLRGRCQIWSVRLPDGTPLSTVETYTRTRKNGGHFISVAQHKGHANTQPPPAARKALDMFMLEIHRDTSALEEYQTWRQKVLRRPLSERQSHAIMQPILSALESTLTGQWAWSRLSKGQE